MLVFTALHVNDSKWFKCFAKPMLYLPDLNIYCHHSEASSDLAPVLPLRVELVGERVRAHSRHDQRGQIQR